MNTILIQLSSLAHEFKSIGRFAGLNIDLLDEIESCVSVPYDGLVEVCDAWLRKCQEDTNALTWRNVAEILSLLGHNQLSHDIMQVYITGKRSIYIYIHLAYCVETQIDILNMC